MDACWQVNFCLWGSLSCCPSAVCPLVIESPPPQQNQPAGPASKKSQARKSKPCNHVPQCFVSSFMSYSERAILINGEWVYWLEWNLLKPLCWTFLKNVIFCSTFCHLISIECIVVLNNYFVFIDRNSWRMTGNEKWARVWPAAHLVHGACAHPGETLGRPQDCLLTDYIKNPNN